MSAPPPAPVEPSHEQGGDAAPAAPVVVALIKDLFFSVKVGNELRAHGYEPVIARGSARFVELVAERRPVLGIIDVMAGVDWDAVGRLVEDAATRDMPLLAFGPHMDVEGLRAAKAAGVTRVVSNGQLHADLPGLVRRYARTG